MQTIETVNYCRTSATLLPWQEDPHFGVGNFDFVFWFSLVCVSDVHAFDVLPTEKSFVRSLCLLSMIRLVFVFGYFYRPRWFHGTSNRSPRCTTGLYRGWRTVIARPRSPIPYTFARDAESSRKLFFLVLGRFVYRPYCCTSRKST